MSIDRSLKSGSGLARHRNVLSRAERITRLKSKGTFKDGETDPLGLPKVSNRKIVTGSKAAKKKEEAAAEGAESTAAS